MNRKLLPLLTAGAFAAATSHAALVLVEDFDGGTVGNALGTADNGNTWQTGASAGNATYQNDPAGGSNVVGAFDGTDGLPLEKYLDIADIANNTNGTLFYRFYAPTGAGTDAFNHAFGLSDVATPNSFGSFETTQQVAGTTPDLTARNGGGYDDVGDVTKDTWYNLWMVVDNTADTYDMYVNTGTGGALAGDLVANDAAFRNGTSSALTTIFFRTGATITTGLDVYYDDIYIDTTGVNLANPIPEPSTYALLAGLATLGLVAWRRRR